MRHGRDKWIRLEEVRELLKANGYQYERSEGDSPTKEWYVKIGGLRITVVSDRGAVSDVEFNRIRTVL